MTKRRTQEEFLQELTHLLISEGIRTLTIAEIAERLKCSRRRLYELAPSKEALFLQVCRQRFDANMAKGHAAARGAPDAAAAISAYMKAVLSPSGMSKAALTDLDATEEGRKVFDAYQVARVRGLESMIEEGVRQNLMVAHNPRLVSEAILGAAFRFRNPQFLEDTGLSLGEAFNEFYEIVLNGLLKKR